MEVPETYDGPGREPGFFKRTSSWRGDSHRTLPPMKLRRWLTSKVGQSWSKVFAEYCDKIRRPDDKYRMSWNFDWLVELNCYAEDGIIYNTKGEKVNTDFYVVDDILYKNKQRDTYRPKSDNDRRKAAGVYWVDDKIFARIDEVWYQLSIKRFEETEPSRSWALATTPYDNFLKTSRSNKSDRKLFYGSSNYYCAAKQQLNKQEIRSHKLNELQ